MRLQSGNALEHFELLEPIPKCDARSPRQVQLALGQDLMVEIAADERGKPHCVNAVRARTLRTGWENAIDEPVVFSIESGLRCEPAVPGSVPRHASVSNILGGSGSELLSYVQWTGHMNSTVLQVAH